MKKTDFNDGICNTCGNVGLAGDKCIVCGDVFSKIDEGIVDPVTGGGDDDAIGVGEPEVYPLEMLDAAEQAEEKGNGAADALPDDDMN